MRFWSNRLVVDEIRFSDARTGLRAAVGNIGFGVLRKFVLAVDSKKPAHQA